jgi:hypothetical protein
LAGSILIERLHPATTSTLSGSDFGLWMAECLAQRLNLKRQIHHTGSKLRILGFEPLE